MLYTDVDVIMVGVNVAHLLPFVRLGYLGRNRPKLVMDVRTIPVDVPTGISGKALVGRYQFALTLADTFADGVTVITRALGDRAKDRLKRLHKNIGVWTSGVQLEHFQRTGPDRRTELGLQGKLVLFHHGTLSANRGLQNAIRAVGKLQTRLPELVFLVVGEGAGKAELQTLAEELGLAERVRFVGKVPYRDVSSYIRTADCAILPFPDIEWWRVSSPIKLMEYLAMGIPIVATAIKAHTEVAGQTGGIVLADNDDPEVLAEAICSALEHPLPLQRTTGTPCALSTHRLGRCE